MPFAQGRVLGANDRLNVGFVGCGGRMNTHIDYIVGVQKKRATFRPWPSATFTIVASNVLASAQGWTKKASITIFATLRPQRH